MTGLELSLVLLAGLACPVQEKVSDDAFQQTAALALAGHYGPLQDWQRRGYTLGVQRGTQVQGQNLWVTHYWPAEGPDSRRDCRGNPCTLRTAACNQLPYGTVVWLENPCGLRTVLDVGSKRNDPQARRYSCAFWLDRWVPRPKGNYITAYAVIPGE